jgi:hypothetical protein
VVEVLVLVVALVVIGLRPALQAEELVLNLH